MRSGSEADNVQAHWTKNRDDLYVIVIEFDHGQVRNSESLPEVLARDLRDRLTWLLDEKEQS